MRWLAAGVVSVVALGAGYYGVQQRLDVEAGIQDRVGDVLSASPEFSRVSLDADEGKHEGVWGRAVYLQGRVTDGEQLDALKDAVGDAGGVRKVIVEGVREVAFVPNAADYTFSASKSGEDVSIKGLAGDFDAQQALIALSGDALDADESDLNISLADPMPEGWVNSVSAGLSQLQGLERGSLSVTGEEAILSGTATTADAYRTAQQFPAVMGAEAVMPGRIGSLDLALGRYTFGARKRTGTIALTGGMPDQATLGGVEAYAGEVFPGYEVTSDMLVSSGVPSDSWGSDAKAAIDALKSYDRGSAYMGMGGLAMSGQLADGAAQGQTIEEIRGSLDADTRLLTGASKGAFFTDLDRARLDLFSTYGEGETEMHNGFVLGKPSFDLTAEECMARQQQLTAAYPIAFDLGDATPNQDGALTLDALAGIQRACADAMSGYEVTAKGYNRIDENNFEGLSADRAAAVVEALGARGVDTARMQSVGLGLEQPETAIASGPFVELGFFDRATADAEAAARAAEEARLAAEAEAARLILEERRAVVAGALGDVTSYEQVNGYELPVLGFVPTREACAARFSDFLGKATILFASGSAELAEESEQVIDGVAAIARACASVLADGEVEVAGHTDSQGNDASNQTLSEQRATTVLNAITARGVNTANYMAVGYGETRPTADNSTAAGRKANRRIEFNILTNEPEPVEIEPVTLSDTTETTPSTAATVSE